MAKDLLLTIDAGTTGCKSAVFDRRGAKLCSAKREYQTDYPKPNWAEQDMHLILSAVYATIRELLSQVRAADIACVGLSGTMNGCVAVDAQGSLLYPNIIHSDTRAEREVRRIEEVISQQDFYHLTGNRLDEHFTLPKILWLMDQRPEVFKRARWFLNTKDYIYGCMTGVMGVTDYSDASLTTMLDIKRKTWADELLGELGIPLSTLPRILPGHDVSGRVSRETADSTGLLVGTPVAIGGGDGACAGRGAGLGGPGAAYCCIGSSAWVSQLTREPLIDPGMRLLNYIDMSGDVNHALGTIQTGAAAYDWAVQNMLGGMPGDVHAGPDYYRIESMARQIEPGAEGVLFLSTLMGERTPYWDPNTRGCLLGFSLYHDQRHVARAVYEGVAMSLNQVVRIMSECGEPIRSGMMLTGGGARSGLWPDIFASVFNLPIRVHITPGEGASLGAAMAAGVGIGLFDSYEQAAMIVRERSSHEPNPAWVQRYEQVFEVYRSIYGRVKPLFDDIAAL